MWRDFSRAQKALVVVGVLVLSWVAIAAAGHILAPPPSAGGGSPPLCSATDILCWVGVYVAAALAPYHDIACVASVGDFAGCTLNAIANAPATIYNDIASFVTGAIGTAVNNALSTVATWITNAVSNFGTFIEGWVILLFENTVATILGAANAAITTVENWVLGIVFSVESAVVGVLDGVAQLVGSVAQATGFFGPLVAAALFALFIVAGVVLLYFAVVVLFAFGKTLFNLL